MKKVFPVGTFIQCFILCAGFMVATVSENFPNEKHHAMESTLSIAALSRVFAMIFQQLRERIFFSELRRKKMAKPSFKKALALLAVPKRAHINVLLADDDEDDRKIFEEAMQQPDLSVNVEVVKNGEELMNVLESKRSLPDLLFLDLNMPMKNGYDCLREIRSSTVLRPLPVIIYSTSSDHEHINQTFNSGATFYLCKPDSFSELKNAARKILLFDWSKNRKPVREKFLLTGK